MWALAIVLLLAWPAGDGSLGVKTIRWLADPRGMLPQLPPPLSMELDDNADAVAEHDAAEQEYYRGGEFRLGTDAIAAEGAD